MVSPFVTFTVSNKFNNYKPEKSESNAKGGGGMDMEE